MKNSLLSARSILLIISFLSITSTIKAQTTIGLELYSFRAQFAKDVRGTLEKISKMGFKELEGGGTYGLAPAEFKKMLDEYGLKMISWGADFAKLEQDPKAIADEAKFFGAKYLVCFWIPHTGTDFTLDDTKKAVTVFNNAGKIISENGLSLTYHPHGYEFRPHEGATLFDYLVKNTDKKYFNFEMDVFWVKHPGQDPVAILKKYPDRFPLLHLKDRKPGTPGNQNGQADVESNVVLGTGDVGIAEIMTTAKKIGVKHYFIEDESSRSEQQVPESVKFLKKW